MHALVIRVLVTLAVGAGVAFGVTGLVAVGGAAMDLVEDAKVASVRADAKDLGDALLMASADPFSDRPLDVPDRITCADTPCIRLAESDLAHVRLSGDNALFYMRLGVGQFRLIVTGPTGHQETYEVSPLHSGLVDVEEPPAAAAPLTSAPAGSTEVPEIEDPTADSGIGDRVANWLYDQIGDTKAWPSVEGAVVHIEETL